ncbi:hypothetical protein JAAARDRAFT_40805 [Jaapia argillacea MUCL 33604]|uniref:Uncharacterized protein n=1 Tax=Jaapia argillacea MUCL 33604 TaxID=933084 RepID=A0A067PA28_9AGAM|nr:hypothetical protein JAAARDRAFT_40805 [Jaapia argillacea MUCL 33604]
MRIWNSDPTRLHLPSTPPFPYLPTSQRARIHVSKSSNNHGGYLQPPIHLIPVSYMPLKPPWRPSDRTFSIPTLIDTPKPIIVNQSPITGSKPFASVPITQVPW